jgi:hypothetical protein
MRISISKSLIAGLAALSLAASVFATMAPAAAGTYDQHPIWNGSGSNRQWQPQKQYTHNCRYEQRSEYLPNGDHVSRVEHVCD